MTTVMVNALFFLDRVNVDYPADYRGVEDDTLPSRYGTARYGENSYIQAVSSLILDINTDWKILNINTNLRNHTITYKIREV